MASKKEAKPDAGEQKLTDKQEMFVREYLIDLNATQAASRAGYKGNNLDKVGSELLGKTRVAARIAELKDKRADKLEIDAEWVLRRLKSISDRCMQAEPVMTFSPADKAMVHKEDDEGNKLYQFDSNGANKATEMIGKHIGFFEKDNDQKKADVILTIGGKAVNG
ncbi:terminase small subunit [Pontibacter beigongshangensis]|uniref:terminase small subunit n=1 Tax=Pontibacter beigongshangensis TaxID=2574733 RepID=UPI00164FAEFA|nr:terminase small subunit [Pontibacter beigongshangensis]